MFDAVSERLQRVLKDLKGQGRLTEENISSSLREVRMALLEADVALPVVKNFIEQVKARTLDKDVATSLTPGQAVIKIVNQELIALMGETSSALNLNVQPPAVILVAGLQGAGKTTTIAKLARHLKQKMDKKVAVVSCDVYRPAAIDQLKTLAHEVQVEFIESSTDQEPTAIAKSAVDQASKQFMDVLLVDSAGRLHIDDKMMQEISRVHAAINPVETLFVIDSMMGQDAVNAARAFNETLPLTGTIITKTDGDARGGAVLSVRHVTGKPVKFMGTGEKTDALTPFHPERIASRILGMGDVLSLIEEVEEKADKDKAEKLARKLKKGKGFTLEDFKEQLQQMRKMGGLGSMLDKLPGMSSMPQNIDAEKGNQEFTKLEAIINSMTVVERRKPDVINGSRKRRIASGSGTQIQDVNRLLKQFNQMQKMMKRMTKKGGMVKMLRGMGGKMPPGGLPF
ncbi:MAG: signal recognition particle protein [Gammaproteobacteria bacterium]|nr:signal recognition particle protein [Gammaproteobacteria bacterium]NIN62289.1 signal recognition particle protein [Gammaproteobacteria bacterium]NIO62298.1 signal recognition particle protein [Gammaproteobacteria bacterium]NIP49678.1 signal recognition particle protein [Gammaproteobacteria bacterium]NIQ10903.1 signal recognition particle protein [Gammaproteobacteria bacterium]